MLNKLIFANLGHRPIRTLLSVLAKVKAFDSGKTLPGLPAPAVRLTVGYWLDPTQTQYIRTQIAKPRGRLIPEWCAAITPAANENRHAAP